MTEPTAPPVTRVKSAKRSADLTAMWADPTVGPDGLTYRQRRTKGAADARAAQLARKRGTGGASAAIAPTSAAPPSGATGPKARRGLRRWR